MSGKAVGVNLTALSKILSKHRSTIKKQVERIFDNKIINRPTFPFLGLFKIYPLLVALHIDLPEKKEFVKWVKEDPHIFAAFRSRQSEYNTLIFVYHENITKYQLWMDSLPSVLKVDYGISDVEPTFLSNTSYFSNQLMIKYKPSSGINLLARDLQENGELIINRQRLDHLDFEIMKSLVSGKGMKVNLTLLCDESGLHRKTVEKRIDALLQEGLISDPVCRFPNFFVPPNYVLTFSLFEVKKSKEKVIREIARDYHVPIALKIIHGRYNLLLFGNHSSISDHLRWEENYRRRFPHSFGRANITYLSPEMTISFDPKIVSLCIIRDRLNHLRGRELRKPLQTI
ncbi:MAG: hypothetical protein ACFFA1_06790 [Promethearchaeota archaeon]